MKRRSDLSAIEHVFRHEHGKIIAFLVYRYGSINIEQIEDAVQDALLKAMQLWPFKGTPDNPTSWLLNVAKNTLIDNFRKENRNDLYANDRIFDRSEQDYPIEITDSNISDSQLKMIFACCNPKLTDNHQLILSLKLIGGFSNKELSKALLRKEEAIAKAYTRAKLKFKSEVKTLEIPIEMALATRIRNVLKVIYLIYSEGYKASFGSEILKKDLCYEAIRLALLLLQNKSTNLSEVHALIALMCFHTSRFDARIDQDGKLVDLEHQDTSKYDRNLISIGQIHLKRSWGDGKNLGSYHYQAAIAYYYSDIEDFTKIKWNKILDLYDHHLKKLNSPIIALNRIVPFYMVYGPEKGIEELKKWDNLTNTKRNAFFYSLSTELYKLTKNTEKARCALRQALDMTENNIERNFLREKHYELLEK